MNNPNTPNPENNKLTPEEIAELRRLASVGLQCVTNASLEEFEMMIKLTGASPLPEQMLVDLAKLGALKERMSNSGTEE